MDESITYTAQVAIVSHLLSFPQGPPLPPTHAELSRQIPIRKIRAELPQVVLGRSASEDRQSRYLLANPTV